MYTWREQWLVNGLSENSDEWTGDVKPVGNVHFTLAIVASSRPSSLYFHRTPSFQTITLFRTAPLKNPTLKSRLFYLNQQSSLRDRRNDRAHTDRLKSVHESDGLDNRTPPFGFSLPCPPQRLHTFRQNDYHCPQQSLKTTYLERTADRLENPASCDEFFQLAFRTSQRFAARRKGRKLLLGIVPLA